MATKPTPPTVPPAPSRANPGTVFSTLADAFAAFQTTFRDYIAAVATFVDERADEVAATALSGTLPSMAGKALNFLRINSGETAAEFRTAAQVRTDIGAAAVATASAGVGQFLGYQFVATVTLPSGGTWKYTLIAFRTVDGTAAGGVNGFAAGGTNIGAAISGAAWYGWAERVS